VAIATKAEEEHQPPPPVTTQIEYSSDREYDATSTSIIVKPKALFFNHNVNEYKNKLLIITRGITIVSICNAIQKCKKCVMDGDDLY